MIPLQLQVNDHRRDILGLQYVYPVVSRRAGGVSLGINLNPNNACNWRCIYCQVPNLQRGGPPPLDLLRLQFELDLALEQIVHGDFLQRSAPPEARRLNDIAFSGNGEPTASPQFAAAIGVVGDALRRMALLGTLKTILITNGSLCHQPRVQQALALLPPLNGELWFKIDEVPEKGFLAVNQVAMKPAQILRRLAVAAEQCPTWVQTCLFALDGQPPTSQRIDAYLALLDSALQSGTVLQGVLLYGLARPSTQPEAPRLSRLPADWMQAVAARIEGLGLPVKLSV